MSAGLRETHGFFASLGRCLLQQILEGLHPLRSHTHSSPFKIKMVAALFGRQPT